MAVPIARSRGCDRITEALKHVYMRTDWWKRLVLDQDRNRRFWNLILYSGAWGETDSCASRESLATGNASSQSTRAPCRSPNSGMSRLAGGADDLRR